MSDLQEGQIIEQIYNLATSPNKYDDFMRLLQEKLETVSQEENASSVSVIGGHLKRASDLIDIVTPWQRGSDAELHHYLSMRMQAVIAVDHKGDIRDANLSARSAYDLSANATLDQLPIDSHERTKLLNAIQNATSEQNSSNTPTNVQRFYNIKSNRSLIINIEQRADPATGETLAILVTSDVSWPSHLGSLLQYLFELTHAEVEVIRFMVEGVPVKVIAKRRGSSPATVRNQLRSIFSKTDTSSQLECTRMVFGLALMHDAEEGKRVATRIQEAEDIISYPRYDQRSVLMLNNGREIEYSIFGAENSQKTVLFYHDQAFGDCWFRDAVDKFTEQGIRIIAPLRPGFGHTTLYQGESSEPVEFAPDVCELLDHLNVGQAALIGMGSGLVHGLAAASLMPHRITSISIGHPLLPVIEDADLEGLNGYNYLIPNARLHFPQSIRFLCKAGFAFVQACGPEAFVSAVLRAAPKDVEWVSRPEIMATITEGIYVHGVNGYLGNYGDINYRKDWRYLLENCPVPVRLVIGEHDRNVQWAAARRWAKAKSNISLHVMPESGYLVIHQHASKFLEWSLSDLQTKQISPV